MRHIEPWNLHVGDCCTTLAQLPEASAHCCVTSPPYWGLRDYGCDGQVGLEETPDAYVASMVRVFRAVARVLRPDGTLWLNLGDSYVGNASSGGANQNPGGHAVDSDGVPTKKGAGLKTKDLCGIPWRVAFALQADGWYLRSDIIWHKPNPMPESVRDRPTNAHEHLFLLAHPRSGGRYFYDDQAIRERATSGAHTRKRASNFKKVGTQGRHTSGAAEIVCDGTRNVRDVWTVVSRPFAGAHFAVMPPGLISPCIKAGTAQWCCTACGSPQMRQKARTKHKISDSKRSSGNRDRNDAEDGRYTTTTTTGFALDCEHAGGSLVPSVVLDPFAGACTTGVVAYRLGRRFVGCELNAEYAELGRSRMTTTAARYKGIRFQVVNP